MPPSAMNSTGKPERQQRVRVLQRVERQVAADCDVVVAEPPRGEGVRELVQAQRHQPAGDDEDEHPDVGSGRTSSAASHASTPPATVMRHDRQEDRAGPHRLVQRADVHRTKLPSTNGQPALGVPIERRASDRPRAGTPSRTTSAAVGAELRGAAGHPAPRPHAADSTLARRPGMVGDRLDPHPGHLAVEEHGVVDDGLAARSCAPSRRGGSQYAARTITVAGLVADQRNPLRPSPVRARRACHGRATKPTSTSSRSVRSSRVSTAARSACRAPRRRRLRRRRRRRARSPADHEARGTDGRRTATPQHAGFSECNSSTSAVRQRGSSRSAGIGWLTGCTQY